MLGAAIAQWICLPLPSCHSRFEAIFFKNHPGSIYKTSIFVKVVWKLFQFKKIMVSDPGFIFLRIETFSESGGLPQKHFKLNMQSVTKN